MATTEEIKEILKHISTPELVAVLQNHSKLSCDLQEVTGILPENDSTQIELRRISALVVDEINSRTL